MVAVAGPPVTGILSANCKVQIAKCHPQKETKVAENRGHGEFFYLVQTLNKR